MSERSVIEHGLTVYLDGDKELANKVIDQFAHSLAERVRDIETPEEFIPITGYTAIWRAALNVAATAIGPEVSG
jgi:ABC-type Fe2+-enterobactin transport system substrate-binding protein